ncbi:MAG: glycosyltransferase [candidate division WOR-3 bacterium]|jgi:dolichyl-phosphate beta-glucosyltransferase
MKVYVSLIIPAYNEEQRIGETLNKVLSYLEKQTYTWEVIVVDDGSTDKTSEIVSKYNNVKLIKFPHNRGKGAAVREGMLNASGKYRIFTDADLSTPIEDLELMLYHLENGADVCIGSRELDPTKLVLHQPKYRQFIGRLFRKIVDFFRFL